MANAILDQLVDLSVEELDEVIKAARALKPLARSGSDRTTLTAAVQGAGTDPYDYVLAVICQVCRDHGLDLRGVAQAKKCSTYPTFQRTIPYVAEWVQGFVSNRAVEVALLKLIYEHLAETRRFNLSRMLSHTSSIPQALDEIFPGYYQTGMLPVAVRKLEARWKS